MSWFHTAPKIEDTLFNMQMTSKQLDRLSKKEEASAKKAKLQIKKVTNGSRDAGSKLRIAAERSNCA